eukprot:m.59087 g.59087  ORF g.59087 m.59087 type:complete len:74 (+) comp22654_c0_seq1:874-1095(+)
MQLRCASQRCQSSLLHNPALAFAPPQPEQYQLQPLFEEKKLHEEVHWVSQEKTGQDEPVADRVKLQVAAHSSE